MLNRRYLRIKVFQGLYAYWQSDGGSAAKVEKELFVSIDRTYDMYVQLMLLFGEMRRVAENRIEERRSRRLPSAEDLSPNRRFVDNPVLVLLSDSKLLLAESEKRRTSWVGEGELLGKLFRTIEGTDLYKAYMADREPSHAKDLALLRDLFLEHISDFEALHDLYEARSVHWLEDLDLACTMVKRSLEGLREGDEDLVLNDLTRDTVEERDFVTPLFRRTIEQSDDHERSIAEKASNWEADRIALSDMILMKMALTEAKIFDQIPVKVTLNEYIEIAKAYSTPKSKNFINGILDKLFLEMKDSGAIRKVGRGLLEN